MPTPLLVPRRGTGTGARARPTIPGARKHPSLRLLLPSVPVCALAIWLQACATAPTQPPRPPPTAAGAWSIRVGMTDHGHTRVVTVPLEEYVMGSILAELNLASLDPDAADRILQVQALLARTYAVANLGRHSAEGFDLCTTTHCQLYSRTDGRPPEWVRLARQAVAHTAGQIVLYQGRPIQALFHADCGGQTSAARSVWGGEEPYLSGVTDRHVSPRWRFSVPSDELSRALRRDPRTAVRGRLHRIEILRRDPAGRAVEVSLVGDDARMVRADHLRAVMMRAFGAHSLRSTRFDVHQDGRNQVFEGSGLGHGVGLCQVGALTQAKDGRSPAAIVHFYYPGVEIGRLTPSLWSRAAAAR